jgi:hypothetical protein
MRDCRERDTVSDLTVQVVDTNGPNGKLLLFPQLIQEPVYPSGL